MSSTPSFAAPNVIGPHGIPAKVTVTSPTTTCLHGQAGSSTVLPPASLHELFDDLQLLLFTTVGQFVSFDLQLLVFSTVGHFVSLLLQLLLFDVLDRFLKDDHELCV